MAKDPKEELNNFNLSAEDFIQAVAGMSEALKENAKAFSREEGEAVARSVVQSSRATKLADELKGLQKEGLTDRKKAAKFEKLFNEYKSIQVELEVEAVRLQVKRETSSEGLLETEEARLKILKDSVESFENFEQIAKEVADRFEDIDKQAKFFDDIADATSGIPVLKQITKSLADAKREAAATGDNTNFLGASLKNLGKALGAVISTTLLKGLVEINDRITQISRNLNVSTDAASKFNRELVRSAGAITNVTGKDLLEANMAIASSLGVQATISGDLVETFSKQVKLLGLSSEQASFLANFTSATGEGSEAFTTSLIGNVAALNEANDASIQYQSVLKEVSDTSAATLLTTGKFSGGIAKAAFQARRFGLSLKQLESISSNILDFETSINNELNAELLTGKELNLDRARLAAITGNQAVLAEEVAEAAGSSVKFGEMNVVAQNALAASFGMSREELAQMLVTQEALQKVSDEYGINLNKNQSIEEQIAKLEEQGLSRQQALRKLGRQELLRQERNQSLQEAFAETFDTLAESAIIFGNILNYTLVPLLKGINNTIDGTVGAFGGLLGFLTKISVKLTEVGKYLLKVGRFAEGPVKSFGLMFKFLNKVSDTVAKLGNKLIPNLFKTGAKTGAKSALKKIPVLGLLVGAGLGLARFMKGDVIGGLMELGSGAASLFPGIGTGISFGLDGLLLAKDSYDSRKNREEREKNRQVVVEDSSTEMASGGIVVKRVNNATVGEAGPEAVLPLNQFYSKLEDQNKKLIDAISMNRNIYMDSNKVNNSIFQYATRMA